jgi:sphinganine C4-monooxygenase
VHHQLRGTRFNFSQPFFVTWDKVFGTYMPYVLEEGPDGGLQARSRMEKASSGNKQN